MHEKYPEYISSQELYIEELKAALTTLEAVCRKREEQIVNSGKSFHDFISSGYQPVRTAFHDLERVLKSRPKPFSPFEQMKQIEHDSFFVEACLREIRNKYSFTYFYEQIQVLYTPDILPHLDPRIVKAEFLSELFTPKSNPGEEAHRMFLLVQLKKKADPNLDLAASLQRISELEELLKHSRAQERAALNQKFSAEETARRGTLEYMQYQALEQNATRTYSERSHQEQLVLNTKSLLFDQLVGPAANVL